MKKLRRFVKGLSFKFDALFIRNLTLIVGSILIWRGIWNIADVYLLPSNFLGSNIFTIVLGLFLLFVFDSEVEMEEKEHHHKHLSNDLY